MNSLEKIFLEPLSQEFFWIGAYRRAGMKAKRVGFCGPLPPCHEFEFGKGNVGMVAQEGIRKVVGDVSDDSQYSVCFIETASELIEPIFFENKLLGVIDVESDEKNYFTPLRVEKVSSLAKLLAPIFLAPENDVAGVYVERNLRILSWLQEAKSIAPELCDWLGIYFKESFLFPEKKSTDLILGPYLGAATDHIRIPLNRGFCGLALAEERVVNVSDVTKDARHIACSMKTRSELVIPLKDKSGNFVAELDIDSNQLDAFSQKNIELKFTHYAATFAELL